MLPAGYRPGLVEAAGDLGATGASGGSVGLLVWGSGELPIFLAEFGATHVLLNQILQ